MAPFASLAPGHQRKRKANEHAGTAQLASTRLPPKRDDRWQVAGGTAASWLARKRRKQGPPESRTEQRLISSDPVPAARPRLPPPSSVVLSRSGAGGAPPRAGGSELAVVLRDERDALEAAAVLPVCNLRLGVGGVEPLLRVEAVLDAPKVVPRVQRAVVLDPTLVW